MCVYGYVCVCVCVCVLMCNVLYLHSIICSMIVLYCNPLQTYRLRWHDQCRSLLGLLLWPCKRHHPRLMHSLSLELCGPCCGTSLYASYLRHKGVVKKVYQGSGDLYTGHYYKGVVFYHTRGQVTSTLAFDNWLDRVIIFPLANLGG